MKLLLTLIFVSALSVAPSCGQSYVQNAAFRIYNTTETVTSAGGTSTTSITATRTRVFIDSADAIGASLGSNTVAIESACGTSFSPCHADATCTDFNSTLGVIECSCRDGYAQDTASSTTYDLLNATTIIAEGTDCQDVDECATTSTSICGTGTDTCFNSIGSYSCNCSSGFTYNNATQACDDIDECTTSPPCATNATCTNLVGSYTCACNAGFSGTGVTCTEIDECAERSIDCGGNGNCSDPAGATYSCVCFSGYTENATVDPRTCEDIDECAGSPGCDAAATCTNTNGSFTCGCNSGYTGDGTTCTDINECDTNPCDANATCANDAGTYTCTCNTGFNGNGTSCQENTLDFCYRLSITYGAPTSGNTSSRATEVETAVTDFLTELEGSPNDFEYSNVSHTLEAVLGNISITEFIVEVCLNGSSNDAGELTDLLNDFNFTSVISGNVITVLEYNECVTNYGNCSSDASCTNTDGDFTCACFNTHADRSTSGVNGTVCELPTSFSCSSDTVNVTAYLPYFTNLGINETTLLLGGCSGTVSGDDLSFVGDCDAVLESNDTHLSYKWNLTNVNESASITIGTYVTIPITCTFDRSQNVSFNFSADRADIVFNDDLNNLPGDNYDFTAEMFSDAATSNRLTGAVNTDTKIYFRLGTSNTLPSDVRIQCNSFSTRAADGSSSSIELLNGAGCPAARTSSNERILDTLDIVNNGRVGSRAVIGVDSHFYGTSRFTMATFSLTACIETGGGNCNLETCSRRRRSVVTARLKRQTEENGEAQVTFERRDDDPCSRDCGEGACIFDSIRNQECVCADDSYKTLDGTCIRNNNNGGNEAPVSDEDQTVMIVLIVLGCLLVLMVGALIFAFLFKRRNYNQKEVELSHVNTHAITS